MNETLLILIITQGALATTNLILNGDFENHPPYNTVITCPTSIYAF